MERRLGKQSAKKNANAEIVTIRRRQQRAAVTRQKIVKAAAVEFAAAGFDGTTTRSIATRANVPHGLVIYHFQTKLSVWRAVTEDALQFFHNEAARLIHELKGRDDVTLLREAQRLFIRISAKRPELNWILSHNVAKNSATLKSLIGSIIGKDIDRGIDLIRRVQSLGRYVEGDPAHLHYLFIGAASRIFTLAGEIERTMGQSPFDERFLERHMDLCQRLFFREPSGGKPRTMKVIVHHAEMTVSTLDDGGLAD